MIDIDTYKTLHPESALSRLKLHADIDMETATMDKTPTGDSMLVFPPSITGYNLRQKKWGQHYRSLPYD